MYSRLFVVTAVVLLTLSVPTAAITLGASGTDTMSGLELAPAYSQSSNGQYATVEDGDLTLELAALNERAVTRADEVFTITAVDDAYEVWLAHDVDGLTLYRGSDSDTAFDGENRLELETGETAYVGVSVDTRGTAPAKATFDVHADPVRDGGESGNDDGDGGSDTDPDDGGSDLDPTPSVELTGFDVAPTDLEAGQSLTAYATYENDGSVASDVTVGLTIDGTVVDRRTITLEAGESRTIAFERELIEPGTVEVGLDGYDDARTVTVSPVSARLTAVDLAATSLSVGETLLVNATYENRGGVATEHAAALTVDGIVVDQRAITLEAGESRTVTFDRSMDRAGAYEVAIDDRPAERVTVRQVDGEHDIELTAVDLETDRLLSGESAVAAATYANRGNQTGNVTAELAVGGVVVETALVELEPGARERVTFEWPLETPGTYEVAIDGVRAGSVTVFESSMAALGNRVLRPSTAAATVPPLALGGLVLLSVANRRRDLWPVWCRP